MADAPKPKKKGDVFGLPWWGWVASLGGAVVVYVLYKRHEADVAAADQTASTATTGGSTIPSGSPVTTTSPTYDTLESWEAAALSAMTGNGLNAADALNGITDWLNGSCVDAAQYSGLSNILETVGLPPGFSSLPTLSVCTSSSTTTTPPKQVSGPAPKSTGVPLTAPKLPASLSAAMTNNGEHVVSDTFDTALNEWVYLTNKGGVYTLNKNGTTTGTTFYGSYLGLPAKDQEGSRTFQSVTIGPGGEYILHAIDAAGKPQTYTFNTKTPQVAKA